MIPLDLQGMVRVDGSTRDLGILKDRLTFKVWDTGEEKSYSFSAAVEYDGALFIPRVYYRQKRTILPPSCEGDWVYVENPMEVGPEFYPEPRSHQLKPISQTLKALEDHPDVVLEAYTGSGKTVMGCYIACKRGQSTLILVDQEKLRRQWVDTLVDLFGYVEEEIGLIQGKTLRLGSDFTIGMIQSIYGRDFPDAVYDHFGTVLYDEVQVCGADQFSNVLNMFGAANRIGLSATPDRKDSKQKLIDWHLDGHRVVLEEKRERSSVRFVESKGVYSWYGNTSSKDGRYITELVEDADRNELITDIIKVIWEQNRTLLVIGARTHHLQSLEALCLAKGIPSEDMLAYYGKEQHWRYKKLNLLDEDPSIWAPDWEKGTPFTPVSLELKEKKIRMHQRDHLLGRIPVLFATYSVFTKGVDVPALDTGLDVTSKTSFTQIHGRILRPLEGKRNPIWVTIRDVNNKRGEYQFAKRLREMMKSNVEVLEWDFANRKKRRVNGPSVALKAEKRSERLKDAKIRQTHGGRGTIETPNMLRT